MIAALYGSAKNFGGSLNIVRVNWKANIHVIYTAGTLNILYILYMLCARGNNKTYSLLIYVFLN